MNQTFGATLKKATEETFLKSFDENVRRQYIEALWNTQLFEVALENLYSALEKRGAKYFENKETILYINVLK